MLTPEDFDLHSVNVVYRPRSWNMIFLIALSFTFGALWALPLVLPLPVEGFDTLHPFGKLLYSLVSVFVWSVGIYLIQQYRNQEFRIKNGELVHVGASGQQSLRVPLTDVLSVIVSRGEGWSCSVKTRSGSFTFTNTLRNHEEFSALLEYAAKHNPTNIQIDFPRQLARE